MKKLKEVIEEIIDDNRTWGVICFVVGFLISIFAITLDKLLS